MSNNSNARSLILSLVKFFLINIMTATTKESVDRKYETTCWFTSSWLSVTLTEEFNGKTSFSSLFPPVNESFKLWIKKNIKVSVFQHFTYPKRHYSAPKHFTVNNSFHAYIYLRRVKQSERSPHKFWGAIASARFVKLASGMLFDAWAT